MTVGASSVKSCRFYQQTNAEGEQSKGTWHCEYTLNTAKIPMTNGYFDITGLQYIPIGYDGNYAKVRFRHDLMQTLFGACSTCWKNLELCPVHGKHGHQGTSNGKKRAHNGGNNASFAMARMAKKAEAAQAKKRNF